MDGAISMEEFGAISPDWFNERRVEDVIPGDGAEGSPVWSIKYENDGLVHNFDPTLPIPRAIKGAQQTLVVLGSEYNGVPVTELRFGLEVVYLNPVEYAMYDARLTKGQIVYMQQGTTDMPPEPPASRVADGPTPEEEPGETDDGA